MKKSTILSVISAVVVVLVAVFVLVMVLRKPHTAGGEPEVSQPGEITWDSLTEPDSPAQTTTTAVSGTQQTASQNPPATTTTTVKETPGKTSADAAQTTTSTKANNTGSTTRNTSADGLKEEKDPAGDKFGELF